MSIETMEQEVVGGVDAEATGHEDARVQALEEFEATLPAQPVAKIDQSEPIDINKPIRLTETVVGVENRTRKSEIQANIDLWHSLGIEIDEKEVKKAIKALPEVEGHDWYLVIPEGLTLRRLLDIMSEQKFKVDTCFNSSVTSHMIFTRRSPDTYAVAAEYCVEPDHETILTRAQSVDHWMRQGADCMTLMERLVAELRYHAETGGYLDPNTATLCPNSRWGLKAPFVVGSDPVDDTIRIETVRIFSEANPVIGVRRVTHDGEWKMSKHDEAVIEGIKRAER